MLLRYELAIVSLIFRSNLKRRQVLSLCTFMYIFDLEKSETPTPGLAFEYYRYCSRSLHRAYVAVIESCYRRTFYEGFISL